MADWWLVFSSGLLSATLLPGNSEVVFSVVVATHPESWPGLLMAVTAGNTIGGCISWGLGRVLAERFPAQSVRHDNAIRTIRRWGSPALLLSWVPFVGDPLCVAAGWLKTAPLPSLLFIAFGKLLRYALIVWLVVFQGVIG